jgi:hypothetical protein
MHYSFYAVVPVSGQICSERGFGEAERSHFTAKRTAADFPAAVQESPIKGNEGFRK